MHVIYGSEKHLKQKDFIFRGELFNGLLLVKNGEQLFTGHYIENGILQTNLPKMYELINLECMTFEDNLEIDELDIPYLDGKLFEGSAIVECDNLLNELTVYVKDEMPFNVHYDSDGEIEYFEKDILEHQIMISIKKSRQQLTYIKLRGFDKGTLSIRYDSNKVNSLHLMGEFNPIFISIINETLKSMVDIEPFIISSTLELSANAYDSTLLDCMTLNKVDELTLEDTELSEGSMSELIKLLKPKKICLEDNAILNNDINPIIEMMRSNQQGKVELSLSHHCTFNAS